MKVWKSVPNAVPIGVIGVVVFFGLPKILMNVANFGSGLISGDVSDAFVEGTLRSPFDITASAWLLVVRYLSSAQASSLCLAPFGMPMIVPLTLAEPYSSGWASSTGIGAV